MRSAQAGACTPSAFGGGGRHIDIRFGLMRHGPLDRGAPTAPCDLRLGIVGTQETIAGVARWLGQCRGPIAAKPKNRLPNLFVPFPGCAAVFGVDLLRDPVFRASIAPRDMERLLPLAVTPGSVDAAVEVFLQEAAYLVENTKPHVVICAPPAVLLEALEREEEREPVPDDVAVPLIDDHHVAGRPATGHLPSSNWTCHSSTG